MMSGFLGRRRGKGASRDRGGGGGGGGDRSTQRTTGRGMDNLDSLEGMFAGAGQSGEKYVVHKEWTKEPFADDFDDEDLE